MIVGQPSKGLGEPVFFNGVWVKAQKKGGGFCEGVEEEGGGVFKDFGFGGTVVGWGERDLGGYLGGRRGRRRECSIGKGENSG